MGVVCRLILAGYWVSRVLMETPSGLPSRRFRYFHFMAVGLSFDVVDISS